MVWKELGYSLLSARLAARASMGEKADGEVLFPHYNYFTTASSHQTNTGSGWMFVWTYSRAFLALEKVFPHTKEFTA